MIFSLLKHYLDTDTALKLPQSVYCFPTSVSHGVENYFSRLWGMGISDAIFFKYMDIFIYFSNTRCFRFQFYNFYPTALRGCWGIVFTHGVWMGTRGGGGWAGSGKKFVQAVSQKP